MRPRIGVRVKLSSEGSGRWRESAGEKSKFGLFITEILELFNVLKARDMLDCLQLVHCHPGSQLQDIRRVKDAINELAHVYAELKLMGAGLQYIDVGGGLGVDYDGSGTNFSSSMNYTLNEYASDVVYRIASVCNAREIEHPMIISESGRAIAAYSQRADLRTRWVFRARQIPRHGPRRKTTAARRLPQPVQDLFDAYRSVTERRLVECYHDALTAREQIAADVQPRTAVAGVPALAERLYWATCARIRDSAASWSRCPRSWRIWSRSCPTPTSAISRCSSRCRTAGPSTSCFPSCPSTGSMERPRAHRRCWPTSPATRTARSTASSGCATSNARWSCTSCSRESEYYLAAFLVGAYQETLGDLHNLFGDTHVVHIRLHDEGGWWIEEIVKGDTANKVLEYMEYDVAELAPALARDCERVPHCNSCHHRVAERKMLDLTGLPALDLAIGLAFIFFLLSTLAATIQEFIAAILGLRARTLEQGLRSLLEDPEARLGVR